MDQWWPDPDFYPNTGAIQQEYLHLLSRNYQDKWREQSSKY